MTDEDIKSAQLLVDSGYSSVAAAITFGGPVGSLGYWRVLKALTGGFDANCPLCGETCFGTGDCNCMED